MSSLPVVNGFPVVEWDCEKCHAENTADDYGACRCHWCETWVMVVPRAVASMMSKQTLRVNAKFEQPKRRNN